MKGKRAHERKPTRFSFVRKVMPVSMRVAEFDPNTGMRLKEAKNKLDPSKSVWIVAHGMNSSEDAGNISEAIKALYDQGAIQIVSVNWDKAAKDPTKTGLDVVWTDVTGKWAGQQLIAAGFAPEQVNGWGHSHGVYVLHSTGEELMKLSNGGQMNTFIASDPAGNVPLWTGYDHTKIGVANVSMRSISFESSLIADSDFLAGKADIAFRIESASTYDPRDEHSLGLTTVTEIFKHEKKSPGPFSNFLSFEEIASLNQEDFQKYKANAYRGEFEGVIDVSSTWAGEGDDAYLQGNPQKMRYKKPGENTEQTIYFTTFA